MSSTYLREISGTKISDYTRSPTGQRATDCIQQPCYRLDKSKLELALEAEGRMWRRSIGYDCKWRNDMEYQSLVSIKGILKT